MVGNIVSPILGYLIGSFLPGYFFGRLKGIDIRKVGSHNAGTVNVYSNIGLSAAIPTAIFDTLKGVCAILLAGKLGANFTIAQISGLLAVLGHIFPFYISFKGGQGLATSVGIILFYLWKYFFAGAVTLYPIMFIAFIIPIIWYIVKAGPVLGSIILPLFAFVIVKSSPGFPYNPFFIILLSYMLGMNIYNVVNRRLLIIKDKEFRLRWWRAAARPFAVLFIIFYLFRTKKTTLVLIGYVALFFIFLDIVRFFYHKKRTVFKEKVSMLFKPGEVRKFSSMTMFLVASFIIVLLFREQIAIVSLLYLIFGDLFAKIFGLAFGKHQIFNKTLEGSLAYLIGCLICGYIIYPLFSLSPLMFGIGALTATIVELLPMGLDDNFTVGILTGTVMTVLSLFSL